jgi:hypothetical protein
VSARFAPQDPSPLDPLSLAPHRLKSSSLKDVHNRLPGGGDPHVSLRVSVGAFFCFKQAVGHGAHEGLGIWLRGAVRCGLDIGEGSAPTGCPRGMGWLGAGGVVIAAGESGTTRPHGYFNYEAPFPLLPQRSATQRNATPRIGPWELSGLSTAFDGSAG